MERHTCQLKKAFTNGRGFTLIELLVVIAIVGLLASVALIGLNQSRVKARDAQRLGNLNQLVKAFQFYYDQYGQYPAPTCPCGGGGWETSDADPAQWLESLAPYFGGKSPVDPVNTSITGIDLFGPRAGTYYFAYYRYPPPAYCQCNTASPTCTNITRPIGVLAARNLEDLVPPNLPDPDMPLPLSIKLPRAVCGDPGPDNICTRAEYIAGQCRDWSQEYDYSVMFVE